MAKIKLFCIGLLIVSLGLSAGAQTRRITGKVFSSSEKGSALSGVSVQVKNTNRGTVTDDQGNFSLSAAVGETIAFSFLGYQTRELVISNGRNYSIQLEPADQSLNAVVVVGYGSQKRADVTGSISSISGKALKEVPVTNVTEMLQGRAAGVAVVSAGNKPGAEMSILIRGKRSFEAKNDPMFVVDGIPITGGYGDINPSDIESIEILKDASATAIYGSRGANGVILVTTKRGKRGRTSVSYDNYFGISKIQRYADVMTGPEFAEYKRESRRAIIVTSTGLPQYDDNDPLADEKLFEPVELESIALGRTTDWQKLLIRDGFVQSHNLSVSGGTEDTRFNIALGYYNEKGLIPTEDFTRFTTRINIDQNIGKIFKIGTFMLGSYSETHGQNINPYNYSADFGAVTENPLGKAYDDDGNLIFLPTSDGLRSNPLSEVVPGAVLNEKKRFRLLANIYGEAQITKDLHFRMNFGPDLTLSNFGDFHGRTTFSRRNADPSASHGEDFMTSYAWENILTYNTRLATRHSLNFTGVYSVQSRKLETADIAVTGLPLEEMEFYNVGAASTINSVGTAFDKTIILSYMGRINYSYDDRFLLTLTARADGSSKFAKGNKWSYFPSMAVAWNISKEGFMSEAGAVSNLKLRVSYGETGNQGIDAYQSQGLLSRKSYEFDGDAAFGYWPTSIANPKLQWETTASFNAGIDFGLLDNRISGTIEVYRSTTTDLLLPKVLPITSGFESILYNVGSKRNRGIELTLSTRNIVSKKEGGFQWSTDLNLFTNKEEIYELSQGKVDDVGNRRFIGYPATVYYDYEKIGIWQLGEKDLASQYSSVVGGIKVKDVNGNGVIDAGDRQILGSDVPDLVGGMTHRFSYKGFDLSVFAFARLGQMIESDDFGTFRFLSGRSNHYNVDYWTKDNPTNAYPQPNANLVDPIFGSTLRYFDGSFIKIRNINLGYNFPSKMVGKLNIQSLRVYVSAQSPFVFAPYISRHNGMDPEFPTNSTPAKKTFLAGLNVNF